MVSICYIVFLDALGWLATARTTEANGKLANSNDKVSKKRKLCVRVCLIVLFTCDLMFLSSNVFKMIFIRLSAKKKNKQMKLGESSTRTSWSFTS